MDALRADSKSHRSSGDASPSKRVYSAPTLTTFGSLRSLTFGSTTGMRDNNMSTTNLHSGDDDQ
jgi:hypothetical protein